MHLAPDPFPLDEIGPLLRELASSVEGLSNTDPQRLIGDRIIIDSAVLQLMLIRRRIDEVTPASLEAAE